MRIEAREISLQAAKERAASPAGDRIGVWERIDIGFFMLWVVVLAIALMRRQEDTASQTVLPGGIVLTPTTNY